MSVDIIIIAIMLWAAFQGWRHGLIKEVTSTVGFFVGLLVAYLCYGVLGDWLAPIFSGSSTFVESLLPVLAFILIWIVVPICLGFVATIVTRTAKAVHLGPLNALGGLAVSVVKYMLLLSFVYSALAYVGLISEEKCRESKLYAPLTTLSDGLFDGKLADRIKTVRFKEGDTIWIERKQGKGAKN